MDASSIIEQYGRGIPAILHSTMIVDVCAYMRSSQSPAALVLSDRGDVRGILTQREIIGAAGRIGSSVMQMMAGELLREQAAVCQMDTQVTDILELLSETGAECVLVCDGTIIKGFITQKDITELLASVMGGNSEPEPSAEQPVQAVHSLELPASGQPDMVHAAHAVQAMPSAVTPAYQPELQPLAPHPVQHVMPTAMPGTAQVLAQQPVAAPVMPQQPGVPMPSMAMPQVPDVPPAAAFAWPQQQPAPAYTTPQPQAAPTYSQPQADMPQFAPAHVAPQPAPQAAPAATGMPSTAGWASFNS